MRLLKVYNYYYYTSTQNLWGVCFEGTFRTILMEAVSMILFVLGQRGDRETGLQLIPNPHTVLSWKQTQKPQELLSLQYATTNSNTKLIRV